MVSVVVAVAVAVVVVVVVVVVFLNAYITGKLELWGQKYTVCLFNDIFFYGKPDAPAYDVSFPSFELRIIRVKVIRVVIVCISVLLGLLQ